ncbi:MAG: DUF2750 domain-containing protein [Clostridium sp.]
MREDLELQVSAQERYDMFIGGIVESGVVWGLKNSESGVWAVAPSNNFDDTGSMLFWSKKEVAEKCIEDEWADYTATSIPVEVFMENWLVGLDGDGLLVGVNWNSDLVGVEVEPIDLLEDIEALIDKLNNL